MELQREVYRTMLEAKRDAALTISEGLTAYLTAEIEAELEALNAEPERDPQLVQRLTEDLMTANSFVEAGERNLQIFRETYTNLPPEVLETLGPFIPLLNGVIIPLVGAYLESSVIKATRKRDDIQADLMELEPAQGSEL